MLNHPPTRYLIRLSLICAVGLTCVVGCSPRVEVALPDKPIEININAKIEHEVRIKVEKDVSKLVENNDELF